MCCSWKMMSFLILTFLALSCLNDRLPVARALAGPNPSPQVVPRRPTPTTRPPPRSTPVSPPLAEYYFTVKEANFTKFCETRAILTINGSYPGPEIRVQRGQRVRVHVLNKGTYGITIHWHGVKQPRNPWSDGPENVTQCPIQPGKSFTYDVILSDEIGTLWWHAHSGWSRATVHGALVILPPANELQYSPYRFRDHTLVFGTWYNQDLKEISDIIAANGSAIADAAGYTLNGLPGDQVTCNNVSEPIYNMTVKRGETHLLHLVHAAMHEPQYFGIMGHNLTVVARDGALVKPFSTAYVLLHPGQTMDVTFVANQKQSRYYMLYRYFDDSAVNASAQNTTGFLIYSNPVDPVVNTTFPTLPGATDNSTAFNFTAKLRSLYSRTEKEVPRGNVNVTRIILTVRLDTVNCNGSSNCPSSGSKLAASFNRISFAAPTKLDVLRAYFRGPSSIYNTSYLLTPNEEVENATYAYQGTNVIELNYGDPVEIVFQAIDFGPAGGHPLHLHGYSFFQVGMNNGTFNSTTDPASYNTDDPPELNTAVVFGSGWTAVRFFARNPGVWFMHCHFESHASWGMATALIVKNGAKNHQKLRRPPIGLPSCRA
ncbi:hypothetical protein SLEP1_g4756 [Rubroshorea leprosula]|uniref:Laccase n=1 Tax=Rubroshorea leprosula TaxID=152421 RepID=A0AAV5I0H2_9ROSI|nr:hypothetical protein SLEP1_g4756 [Rubroshorea leprosula]